jgi:hypothetical protein
VWYVPTKGAHELPLRIVVTDRVPGVALALQRGTDEIVPPTSVSQEQVTFDLIVRVDLPASEGRVGFYGPFAQGPPSGRFVYITVGQRAGQPSSPWDRRAKVPLGGITAAQVREALKSGRMLTVAFAGRGKDGTPTCATVKLAPDSWTVLRVD